MGRDCLIGPHVLVSLRSTAGLQVQDAALHLSHDAPTIHWPPRNPNRTGVNSTPTSPTDQLFALLGEGLLHVQPSHRIFHVVVDVERALSPHGRL